MKFLLGLTIVIVFSGVVFAAPVKTSELYVIKFEASWCRPCRMMTKSFQDPGVKELIKKYGNRSKKGKIDGKPYVVDIDKRDKSTITMVRRYRNHLTGGIPMVLIIDKKGGVLHKITGYRSANALKSFLRL